MRTARAYEQLPELAAELIRLKAEVIVTETTHATRIARQAGPTTPIVMAIVADAVGSGLIASLARPGGNVTGLTSMTAELGAKRVQLFKEAVPRVSRVAVLWNPDTPYHRTLLDGAEGAASKLGVKR